MFDLSPNLIKFAKDIANSKKNSNINFCTMDIRELKTNKIYNHIMCMGVLTYIADDSLARSIIRKIGTIIKEDGYLIIKDTLSLGDRFNYINEAGTYAACYRNENEYLQLFEKIGMQVMTEKTLRKSSINDKNFVSKLFIMKRTSAT